MSYKRYTLIRIIGVIIIAILGATASTTGNPLAMLPPAFAVALIVFLFKRRVKDIVIDERINTIAYKATRLAFLAFVTLAVIAGAILISLGHDSPSNTLTIGLTLAYAVCAMLVFYWIAYYYYNRKHSGKA